MRMTYDPDADAAYIYVSAQERVPENHETCGPSVEGGGAILLAYSSDQHLVGIEILGASRLLDAEVLAEAERA